LSDILHSHFGGQKVPWVTFGALFLIGVEDIEGILVIEFAGILFLQEPKLDGDSFIAVLVQSPDWELLKKNLGNAFHRDMIM